MTFALRDWRLLAPETVARALAREADVWRDCFKWNVSEAWTSIEPARVAGRLPGWVALDRDHGILGWTCFLLHHTALQVPIFCASSALVTRALVEAILASPEAESADVFAFCVRHGVPDLGRVLRDQGFDTAAYRYLIAEPLHTSRPDAVAAPAAAGPQEPAPGARLWRFDDVDALVRLCARAYADPDEIRAFAPRGTYGEWRDYVAGLLAGPGCGALVPSASLVIPNSRGGLDAALLATDLGEGTGHIAQVAVDPGARGRGLATGLVQQAKRILASSGFARVTLLVSSANERAARIYDRSSFRDQGAFLVAVNRHPRRLTNFALAIGGTSTRR